MKKFLKENAYYIYLVATLQFLAEINLWNWKWWVIVIGVLILVTWKSDKEG